MNTQRPALSCGTPLNLDNKSSHAVLHLMLPENQTDQELIEGEITVFNLEWSYGTDDSIHFLQKTVQPLDSAELIQCIEIFLLTVASNDTATATLIVWGHGNQWDNFLGYLKISNFTGITKFLLLDDLLLTIVTECKKYPRLNIQLLMTQCWAHCHSTKIYAKQLNMKVDWFTNKEHPETAARRWDLQQSGQDMTKQEFAVYLADGNKHEELIQKTLAKHEVGHERTILIRYIEHPSIHMEATSYVFYNQIFDSED